MKNKFILSLGFATLVGLSGCATVADFTGANSGSLNASAEDTFLKMRDQAKKDNALDTTSNTYKRVVAVMNRLQPYADQLNKTGYKFNWQLAVVKSEELNAFVLPGGKVVVYTGIVEKLKLTDDEIAAVMGHEMTHALEEHTKNKMGADVLTNTAISLGKQYAGAKIGQLGDYGDTAINFGKQFGVGLPFSRSLENRADYGGLILMARAGYNPQNAVSVWKKMTAQMGAGGPAFLSTHPSNSQRIDEMQKNMPEAMAIYNQARAAMPVATPAKSKKK